MPARAIRLAVLAVACAVVAGLQALPVLRAVEGRVGAGLLHELRGPVAPPDGAVIVTIGARDVAALGFAGHALETRAPALAACLDPVSRAALGRMRNVSDLPRAVHACAFERLAALGATRVAADVFYIKPGVPAEADARLAAALARFGQAVVLERLEPDADLPWLLRRSLPLPEVVAAVGEAQVAFLLLARPGGVWGWLTGLDAHPDALAMPLALAGVRQPAGEGVAAFRVYGPPGTIPHVPLRALFGLAPLPAVAAGGLQGRVVFLGGDVPEDSFPVPFTRAGAWMPGVELAATAWLNLGDGGPLRRAPAWAEGAMAAALLAALAGIVALTRPLAGLLGCLALGAVWLAVALAVFAGARLMLPVAGPVLVLAPGMAGLGYLWKLERLRRVLGRVLPGPIARRIEAPSGETGVRTEGPASLLVVDLAGSTRLAEAMGQAAFNALIQAYLAAVTAPVQAAGGMVVKYTGDGLMAVFPVAIVGPDHAARAVRAARGMAAAVAGLGPGLAGGRPLRIRIGLHAGPISGGLMQIPERTGYDVFGDVVNATVRLEALGKDYFPDDTVVALASDDFVAAAGGRADEFDYCDKVVLRGRMTPTGIYRVRV